MKIKNIEGLSAHDIMQEAEQGARFVYFTYTISLVVVTFKRTSDVFLVRKGESRLKRKWPYILITVLFGCWGIPFGPKYSLQAIRTNIRGGKDVTDEVVSTVAGHILFREKERQKAPAC
ncbi:MAG: hypothetical protein HZA79_09475 [Sphingobacteriales bacterium]|nr:hypothetical protein [Sphingobacteriales bacterium]